METTLKWNWWLQVWVQWLSVGDQQIWEHPVWWGWSGYSRKPIEDYRQCNADKSTWTMTWMRRRAPKVLGCYWHACVGCSKEAAPCLSQSGGSGRLQVMGGLFTYSDPRTPHPPQSSYPNNTPSLSTSIAKKALLVRGGLIVNDI